MKIAFLFGAWSIGRRPLDFNALWSSPRGLTGSDLGVVITAKEMASLGHDVSLFTVHESNKPNTWEGVKLYHINEKNNVIETGNFDAVVSWSEPDVLRELPSKPIKVVCQMLNDFSYCQSGYDDCVDAWTAPCQMLIDHLVKQAGAPSTNKFTVLPLGCDPSWYSDQRVPGRVIWASSADRGLHLLLQEWPKIKAASPNANLRIFYNFDYSSVEGMEPNSNNHPHFLELGHRARYMKSMIKKLQHLDVQHIGSVSRDRIQQEMSEASVMAFPCDTVAFTEGFSVSILEAHASRTVPVITDTDCLGQVYEHSGAIVIKNIKHNLYSFTNAVIKALNDNVFADDVIEKCSKFAEKHSWKENAKKLEQIIINKRKPINNIQVSNSKKPKVSVIAPTNRVGGLDLLFESLKKQTLNDFELILVDAIYNRRKKIVSEKSKLYNFPVKHIEPHNNIFPVANYCTAINTALCSADSDIVCFIGDYSSMEPELLQTHYNFHSNAPKDHILMLPVNVHKMKNESLSNKFPKHRQYGNFGMDDKYQLLVAPEQDYTTAHNQWSDTYAEDIGNGMLDDVMWSIFEKPFDENGILDDIVGSTYIDIKFSNLSAIEPMSAFRDLFALNNNSMKHKFLYDANGMDENMDGSWGFHDTELARRLDRLYGAKFFAMNTMATSIINTRYFLEPRKITKGANHNIEIINAKYMKEYPILHNTITEFRTSAK